ncbi:GspH/FimT family pseudopilin [Sphingomonas immobilis]|uniref:Type II secretion system protein H n=1 Tax=Sphingomonas immobilis TaxID=3063997 RepID=A0ABT8ZUK0_9SPHN|nr:GspH/FimT family pseudopilin [Sphingomonas sp. CA1-15]MDO7841258.1 GspH/FimT family pseudopilin [Sphingomonas sp. CA1-15]
MPISAVGNKRPRESGFTLVELMVVITIIGLASAVVVLAMPDPRGRLSDDAARFAVRTKAARDLAIVQARPVSVWVTPAGYGFEARAGGRWQAVSDKPFEVAKWSDGTQAAIGGIEGRERVVFDETGVADHAIDLRLSRDGEARDVRIGADGSVVVGG